MNAHSIPLALHSHILCWVVTALMTLVCAPVAADTLDDIQQRGELVWGADQEGGGPYVFPDEDNPDVLRGFEVELAAMLAEEAAKLKTEGVL